MKLLQCAGLVSICCAMVACTSTVGDNRVDASGKLVNEAINWPALKDSTLPGGIFPNVNNLQVLGSGGQTKKDLYYLFGRPHFQERKGAREWNYIMKFRQPDQSVKVCLFKVLFDDKKVARTFHWSPSNTCPPKIKSPVVTERVIVKQQVPAKMQMINKKITLDADALFAFNEYRLDSILPEGRKSLDLLARKLRSYAKQGDVRIHITGHTDRIGAENYNMILSQNRANTVMAYLAQNGIHPASMSASGVGEGFPVVKCPTNLLKAEQIDCLQPNRRVDIDVMIYQIGVQQKK